MKNTIIASNKEAADKIVVNKIKMLWDHYKNDLDAFKQKLSETIEKNYLSFSRDRNWVLKILEDITGKEWRLRPDYFAYAAVDEVLKEARWIGKTKKADIDIGKELAEIKSIDSDFVERLQTLLKGKFAEIGKKLKELLKPASKGTRKGLMIFVPDASRQIAGINDEFVKYIVRSVYDNYHDITKGILFRIHMNELFSGDFIMSIIKELNKKVDELTKKKKDVQERYFEERSKLFDQRGLYELSIYSRRRFPQNVFNIPISKPFWDTYKEFKARVKQEHPRVPDDKLGRYIENDYSYREEKRKIIDTFLETIPEYVELEKILSDNYESERNENSVIQEAINNELKQLEFDKIKPILTKMVDQFTGLIANSIVRGMI